MIVPNICLVGSILWILLACEHTRFTFLMRWNMLDASGHDQRSVDIYLLPNKVLSRCLREQVGADKLVVPGDAWRRLHLEMGFEWTGEMEADGYRVGAAEAWAALDAHAISGDGPCVALAKISWQICSTGFVGNMLVTERLWGKLRVATIGFSMWEAR